MKIALRRTRRTRETAYTTAYAWKMLAVFTMLLPMVCSMESSLGKPADIERRKREIAEILLKNFKMYTILPKQTTKYNLTTDHLLSKTEYVKLDKQSTGQYCIDVKEYEIKIKGLKVENQGDIHTIMEDIGVIRCKKLYIDPNTPFELVKMLFERIVVEKSIELIGLSWENMNRVTPLLNDNTCSLREKTVLSLKWAATKPLKIYIAYYPWKFTESILNKWVGTREIDKIYLHHSHIEEINLQGLKMAEGCFLIIDSFSNTKSILLPKEAVGKYMCIQLLNLTNLKHISNICDVYSSTAIDNLILDQHSFKALIETYRKKASLQTVLSVAALDLFCMPHIIQEKTNVSFPWIVAKEITLYVEYCIMFCDIFEIEDMPYYSPEELKSIGIDCLAIPDYKNLTAKLSKYLDKCIWSGKFLKRIGGLDKEQISPQFFKCPYTEENKGVSKQLPQLNICLKDSTNIQEAIEEFQKNYTELAIHAHYSILNIDGLDALEEDTKVLGKMFACMGVKIRVEMLRFHNIKGSIGDETEEKDSPLVDSPMSKFRLQSIEFYNSEISFIRSMLTKYNYFSEAVIVIDCKEIEEEEDLWGLLPKLIKNEFSEVDLRNARGILDAMRKIGCSIDPKLLGIPGNLVLPIENIKWIKGFPHIFDYIFPKKNNLSPTHLSMLEKESLKESSKKRNRRELSYFLVSNSVEEAYKELNGNIEPIYHVVWMGLYIYNMYTGCENLNDNLSRLVGMLKKVFVHLEVLCLLNL
ncbi:hypothetical protein NEAUS07_2420, partial [Nematocida ausubeli]